jgi:hypothetical protein
MAKSLGNRRLKRAENKKQRSFKKIKMKKIFILIIAIVLVSIFSVFTYAENETNVFVSISNGELCLAYEKITIKDIDSDGNLTINDALYIAHQNKYEGGAEAGYAYSNGAYGLKIDKLWGCVNGDGYGYYLNNASAMSLGDTVKNGDHVYAFVYTDTTNWSDTYSFFDLTTVNANVNEKIALTLSSAGFDESWNFVSIAEKNAIITVNGKQASFNTDDDGKAIISFEKEGIYVISANSNEKNLVPAVCIVTVSDSIENAKPSDYTVNFVIISVFILIFSAVASFAIAEYSKRHG